MAMIAVGNSGGFFLTAVYADNQGDQTSKEWELRGIDFAAAEDAAENILDEFQALTDAILMSYNISQRFKNNAISYPASGVNVQDKARIIIQLAGANGKEAHDIPAPKAALFMGTAGPAAKVVDVTNTDLLAYVDQLKATGSAYISDGEAADHLLSGRRVSSKTGMRS